MSPRRGQANICSRSSPPTDSCGPPAHRSFIPHGRSLLSDFISLGADILFPRHCPVCREVLPFPYDLSSLSSLICEDCISELSFIGKKSCHKCGRSLNKEQPEDNSKGPLLCSGCQKHIRLFERNYSLLNYGQLERELMSDIKYHGRKQYIDVFSLLISLRFSEIIRSMAPDVVIPVPIHEKRMKKRGFNQAKLLGEGISRFTGVKCSDSLLLRILDTKAQKGLGYEGRILNLQNAVWADAYSCTGLGTVLVVDDIYTTGSTLEACTEALLKAGVKKVYGICICAGSDVLDIRNSS